MGETDMEEYEFGVLETGSSVFAKPLDLTMKRFAVKLKAVRM